VDWFRFDLREVHPLYDPVLPTRGRPAELDNFEEQVRKAGRQTSFAAQHNEVDLETSLVSHGPDQSPRYVAGWGIK
jgi:hypothetical protein